MYKVYVKKYWSKGATLKATWPGVFSLIEALNKCHELQLELQNNCNAFGYHGETWVEVNFELC